MSVASVEQEKRRASATTIKVSVATRDRLKLHASKNNLTLEEHLNFLEDLADRELRFDALRESMSKMTEEDWAAYREEVAIFDNANTDGLLDETW